MHSPRSRRWGFFLWRQCQKAESILFRGTLLFVNPVHYRTLKSSLPFDISGLSFDSSIKSEIVYESVWQAVGVFTPAMFKQIPKSTRTGWLILNSRSLSLETWMIWSCGMEQGSFRSVSSVSRYGWISYTGDPVFNSRPWIHSVWEFFFRIVWEVSACFDVGSRGCFRGQLECLP